MKKLANEGKTIISTIHQPSSNVLAMFDCVYMLAEGRVAFSGTVNQALEFMRELVTAEKHFHRLL